MSSNSTGTMQRPKETASEPIETPEPTETNSAPTVVPLIKNSSTPPSTITQIANDSASDEVEGIDHEWRRKIYEADEEVEKEFIEHERAMKSNRERFEVLTSLLQHPSLVSRLKLCLE